MAKACGRCKGSGSVPKGNSGWYSKTCPVCGGSGADPRWTTKSCDANGCWNQIDYRIGGKAPKYCRDCQETKHKLCRGCHRTIEYKSFWDNVPEYCPSCRNDWQEKSCATSGCKNTVRYKRAWDSIPDCCGWCQKNRDQGAEARSCKDCGTLIWVPRGKNYERCFECGNKKSTTTCQGCHSSFEYPAHYNNPPSLCSNCKKKTDLFRRDILPPGVRDINGKVKFEDGHVTMYFPGLGGPKGFRVSWDGQSHNLHWTNQNVNEKHPDRHKPPQ